MVLATCLQKNRGQNNTIVSYTLRDFKGNCANVPAQQLYQAMADKQIDVSNLRISTDDKIVDREKGYYKLVNWGCNEQGNRVYKVLRMRLNKTVYKSKDGNTESLELTEQETADAMKAKYVYMTKNDVLRLKAFQRLYPITLSEWESAGITEDKYWDIIEHTIEYADKIQQNKAMAKEYIKYHISDIDYDDIFSIKGGLLEQKLLFSLPKNEAIGFCKMSRALHNMYYAGKDKKKLPVWWKAISSYYGGCSDDSYNDYVYGMIGLGKEAFYDFYNHPTKTCFGKYGKVIYHSTCELFGYVLTCIHENEINM